jgi:LacI family transcriptional regulator
MRIMLEKLRAAGYRRIGLVLPRDFSARDGHGMLAEALLQRYLRSDGSICRPWLYEGDFMRPAVQTGFRRWLKQKTPDVLVCLDGRMREVVENMGLRVPEDLGLAHVNLGPDVQGWSGLNRHSEDKGTAAVDLLVDLLSRNQVGPTTDTRQLLIAGEWVQGGTTSGSYG